MRSAFLLASVLSVIVCGTLSVSVGAQEFLPEEFLPEESDGDRVDTLFNAPHPSEHAGLLGKLFMQQRYRQLSVDDAVLRQFDKSLQGFDSLINLPVLTLDLPLSLDFDVFFGYANVGLKGTVTTGPPLEITALLNAKSEAFTVGTSIYPTWGERWRPFVQIGVQFSRSDVNIAIHDPLDAFADNFVDHQTDLLLNGGLEWDLLDNLAFRMTLHAETSDRFRDSVVTNELILWPHDRIFIRGGVVTSLDHGGSGFTLGGGLAF